MQFYSDIPEWVRITYNRDEHNPDSWSVIPIKNKAELKRVYHVRQEIVFIFEEMLPEKLPRLGAKYPGFEPSGVVFEFDDPVIAADEMGLKYREIKELPLRKEMFFEVYNYKKRKSGRIPTSERGKKSVPAVVYRGTFRTETIEIDDPELEVQGELFND